VDNVTVRIAENGPSITLVMGLEHARVLQEQLGETTMMTPVAEGQIIDALERGIKALGELAK